jgi:hypothetical protein
MQRKQRENVGGTGHREDGRVTAKGIEDETGIFGHRHPAQCSGGAMPITDPTARRGKRSEGKVSRLAEKA